jgi:hypothetical protein
MKKILFLVRSSKKYGTQRIDLDYIIFELIKCRFEVDIYDPKQKILMKINIRETINYNFLPFFLFKTPIYFIFNLIIFIKFCIKNKNKYDIVNACYIRNEYLLFPRLTNKLGKKLILVLFGSDINDRNFIKNNFKKLYINSDKIITTNPTFLRKFIETINLKEIENKSFSIMLPQPQFKLYKEIKNVSKEEMKEKLNIPVQKTTILIGTNSNQNEQHEKIILEILNLNPQKYHFIFPLTNVFSHKNNREIELKKLIKSCFPEDNFTIIEGFISYQLMRDYRIASDIFVNLRLSDQLAASMLESVLANCTIITGYWLPYHDFTKAIKCKLINSISELNYAIETNPITKEELFFNTKELLIKYDNNCIEKWINIFTDN